MDWIKELFGYRNWYLYSPTDWGAKFLFVGTVYGRENKARSSGYVYSSKREVNTPSRTVIYN